MYKDPVGMINIPADGKTNYNTQKIIVPKASISGMDNMAHIIWDLRVLNEHNYVLYTLNFKFNDIGVDICIV